MDVRKRILRTAKVNPDPNNNPTKSCLPLFLPKAHPPLQQPDQGRVRLSLFYRCRNSAKQGDLPALACLWLSVSALGSEGLGISNS